LPLCSSLSEPGAKVIIAACEVRVAWSTSNSFRRWRVVANERIPRSVAVVMP
jgi:hypothetical protein